MICQSSFFSCQKCLGRVLKPDKLEWAFQRGKGEISRFFHTSEKRDIKKYKIILETMLHKYLGSNYMYIKIIAVLVMLASPTGEKALKSAIKMHEYRNKKKP